MQRRILGMNFFVGRLIPMGTDRKVAEDEMDHYRRVQPTREARAGVAEFPKQILAATPWLDELEQCVRRTLATKPTLLTWGMRDFAFPPKHHIPRLRSIFSDVEVVE